MIDEEKIKKAVNLILEAIGEDSHREGLLDTPKRVAQMYVELFSGMGCDPKQELTVSFGERHHEMVITKDIPFYSMCEHHLLPFFGMVHIGYIPDQNGEVVGVSKLARVIEIVSHRLQIQERMVSQIADAIVGAIHPRGVGVVVEASHLCMTMRGVKKPGSILITSAMRGTFRSRPETRSEFLSLIGYHRLEK